MIVMGSYLDASENCFKRSNERSSYVKQRIRYKLLASIFNYIMKRSMICLIQTNINYKAINELLMEFQV